jgi:tetratricopeptide (TPR) repeat protein
MAPSERPTCCSGSRRWRTGAGIWPRRHFQRAEDQSATDSSPFGRGFYYVLDGRPDAALRYTHERLARDPLAAIERTQAAALHVALEQFDSATTLLDEALDLDDQVPMTLVWLGFCRGVQGRFDEAGPLLRSAAERGVAWALSYLVCVLVRAKAVDRARAVHAELERAAAERHVSPMCLAVSHAALGHEAQCLELLRRAEDDRSPTYAMFLLGPGYLALSPEWLRRSCESRKRHVGLAGGPARRARGAAAACAGMLR